MPIELDNGDGEVIERSWDALDSLRTKIEKKFDKWTSYRFLNVPIVNYSILIVFGYLLVKLSFRYHKLYTKSSLVATIFTNVVLYGIADTCAQSIPGWVITSREPSFISSVNHNHSNRVEVTLNSLESGTYRDMESSEENISTAFADYGDGIMGSRPYEVEINTNEVTEETFEGLPFNFRRFFGFICWGFIMAFIQVVWYLFLNSMFNDMPTIVTILERDLVDQLCFSPISLACFFAYSTMVIERGSKDDYVTKMVKLYVTTLFCSFSVWFPVQFINFAVMPRNLQVPFSSSVGVLWNCFLSYRNAQSSS